MTKSRAQLIVGIAISALFLYIAMRGVDPRLLWNSLKSLNWLWAVPFIGLTFLSMWVRAVRWRLLMAPTAKLSAGRLFSPMMAGFAINSLLPARIGEFARAYILGRKEKLPFTSVFATIVVERLFDSVTLLVLLAWVFATLEFDPSIAKSYSTKGEISVQNLWMVAIGLGVLLAGIAAYLFVSAKDRKHFRIAAVCFAVFSLFIFFLPKLLTGADQTSLKYGSDFVISGESLKKLSGKITIGCMVLLAGSLTLLWPKGREIIQLMAERLPYAPRSIRMKISGLIRGFAEGLTSMKDLRTVGIVFILSLLVWFLVGWSMQIMAFGFQDMKMSIPQAMALMVITCIAILIPAAPGYWGLMEVGIVFGMAILNVESDASRALAYSLVVHALQYFPIVAVGLYYLWKEQISIGEISEGKVVE